MSWKYKLGQFVGIILGVTAGSFIVSALFYRKKDDHRTAVAVAPAANQPAGVFDQAVSGVSSSSGVAKNVV